MAKCDPPKRQTKICSAKKNSCNKQELQADDNENTSTSQSEQVVKNVFTPKLFPNVNKSFADKKWFHKELETKLSEELICYILKDGSKVMLLNSLIFGKLLSKWIFFFHFWLLLFKPKRFSKMKSYGMRISLKQHVSLWLKIRVYLTIFEDNTKIIQPWKGSWI